MDCRFVLTALVALNLAMSGCAGTDFVRPAEGELVLGKTTQTEVSKKFGTPMQSGEIMKNTKQIMVSRYAYAAMGEAASYPDVIGARSMVFMFFNNVLVDQEFVSSFKKDSSDFDGGKVASIQIGKSTKAEVIALMGQPSGEAIYPVTANEKDHALVYSYSQAKGNVFDMQFYTKALLVSFDAANVVSNVEYTTSGKP